MPSKSLKREHSPPSVESKIAASMSISEAKRARTSAPTTSTSTSSTTTARGYSLVARVTRPPPALSTKAEIKIRELDSKAILQTAQPKPVDKSEGKRIVKETFINELRATIAECEGAKLKASEAKKAQVDEETRLKSEVKVLNQKIASVREEQKGTQKEIRGLSKEIVSLKDTLKLLEGDLMNKVWK